jgi:16S rRNA (cytosine967-C5)-methyltransferase
MTKPAEDNTAKPDHLANAVPLRALTLKMFEAIAFDRITLDKVLSDTPEFKNINTLDRALVRMMLTTTIRRLGQIDAILKTAMNGDEPKPRQVQSLLRLATAQIVFMNIPDHAAVNLGVELAVHLGMLRQKGLVNAVLRRVAREGKQLTTSQDPARLNYPKWMMDDWVKAFGKERALDAAIASGREAALDLTLKDPSDAAHWAKMLSAEILPTGSLRLQESSGMIDKLMGYDDGAWWVQDTAASLPVKIMGDVRGKTVIDLCAAPGGKSAQLAAGGAHVIAVDRASLRLDLVRRNLERLKLASSVKLVEADGINYMPDTKADIVLIDAPCTATGTIRRNPDIPLHRTPDDVSRHIYIQDKLLWNVPNLLKPGGLLVYAVCSLQALEGELRINELLKERKGYTVEPITAADVGGMNELITKEGYVRTLPSHLKDSGGMDGFFIAKLRYQP